MRCTSTVCCVIKVYIPVRLVVIFTHTNIRTCLSCSVIEKSKFVEMKNSHIESEP